MNGLEAEEAVRADYEAVRMEVALVIGRQGCGGGPQRQSGRDGFGGGYRRRRWHWDIRMKSGGSWIRAFKISPDLVVVGRWRWGTIRIVTAGRATERGSDGEQARALAEARESMRSPVAVLLQRRVPCVHPRG